MSDNTLKPNDRVQFFIYGVEHFGRVLEAPRSEVVFVGEANGRKRWLHRESITKMNEET